MFNTALNIFTFLGLGLLAIAVVYFALRYLQTVVDYLFDQVPIFNQVDKTLAYFISEFVGIGLVILLAIYGMGQLPESAAAVAILATVASGAFIFTSEGWVTDAFAGASLQIFPQYKVGDWITLNGKRGQVARVGLFRTQLSTSDLEIISIKNSKALSGDIINHTAIKLRRLIVSLPVANYGDYAHDLEEFKRELFEITQEIQNQNCPEAIEEHKKYPQIGLSALGPSSDHFKIIFYHQETGPDRAIDALNSAFSTILRPKGVIFGEISRQVDLSN